jgi:Mycothiol maleylpyruvate isomerase N-terminal domain
VSPTGGSVEGFVEAAQWMRELTSSMGVQKLQGPGLGEWNLRELVAHASRAVSVVAEYLRNEPPSGEVVRDDSPVVAAAVYYASSMGDANLHREVAERGRREAEMLGEDPARSVATRVDEAVALVSEAPDTAFFETRFGSMGFNGYLCTRTVELVVHGVDICDALAVEAEVPQRAARTTLAVLAELSFRRGEGVEVIRSLAGRRPLREGFTLFS